MIVFQSYGGVLLLMRSVLHRLKGSPVIPLILYIYMENGKKMYVMAEEAAEMFGVPTGYAYKIIWGLNEGLKVKSYRQSAAKS